MDGLLTGRKMYIGLGFMLLFLNKVLSQEKQNCSDGWKAIHRGCYLFNKTKMTWDEAKASCEEEGAYLISINSVAEKTKLFSELKKKKVIPKLQRQISSDDELTWWIGLRRNGRGKYNWIWEDGDSFNYRIFRRSWGRGEPNNRHGKEDCVEVKYDGKMNDKRCSELRPFICETHKITSRPPLKTTAPAVTSTPTTTPAISLATTTAATTTMNTTAPETTTTTTPLLQNTTVITSSSTAVTEKLRKSTTVSTSAPEMSRKRTTVSTWYSEVVRQRTTVSILTSTTWEESLSPFLGCYQITENNIKHQSAGSSNFLNYDPEGRKCPKVFAYNLNWPETRVEAFAKTRCKTGSGYAKWRCWSKPTCWRGEPDFAECASPAFKQLLQTEKDTLSGDTTPSPEKREEQAVEASELLVKATGSDDVTTEDFMVATKIIKSISVSAGSSGGTNKTTDTKKVKSIVKNIVKAGSNMLSEKNTDTWSQMSKKDKVRSASALLNAMETATALMVSTINQPTNFSTKDDNIELQIKVVDVKKLENKELVYKGDSSENSVSIPVASLQHVSKGGLAKAVFMTHYKMADLLDESKSHVAKDRRERPKIASTILSISLGIESIKLPEPITFSMKLVKELPPKMEPLCSFWDLTDYPGKWSQTGCLLDGVNNTHVTCKCDHLTNFAILLDVQGVKIHVIHSAILRFITLVGCVISIICLFVCFVTFQCFGSIQGERTSIHKNLVACLFIAEVLFVMGIDRTENEMACSLIAGFLHYFFLCMFTWMLIEGLHMVFMLTQVFDAAKSRLPYYYMTAYGAPAAVIAISAGAYYKGYGTEAFCWLSTERYFIWSFAGPVAIILAVNAVVLVYAMSMVCRHSEYVMNNKEKDSANVRTWVQGALSMEVLLGLTWMFGYFYISKATVVLAYIFTVLNSLQGLLIFCFHCLLNKKVMKEYRRVFHIRKRKPSSSSQSQSLVRKHSGSYEVSGRSHETNC